MKKSKFTLIELLVVVAIIGILAAMIMPALAKSQAKSKQASGKNNLRQMAGNITAYFGSQASRPAPDWPYFYDDNDQNGDVTVGALPVAVNTTNGNSTAEGLTTHDPFYNLVYGYTVTVAANVDATLFGAGVLAGGNVAQSASLQGDYDIIGAGACLDLAAANSLKYSPILYYTLKGDLSVGDHIKPGNALQGDFTTQN